jgi:hypothetical protein
MNRLKLSVSLVTLVVFLSISYFGFAQGSNVKVIADFDKPVNVGQGQVLQPGRYTFNLVQDQTDRDVFRVQSEDGKNTTLTATHFAARKSGGSTSSMVPGHTSITLENVGGQQYLHRISLGGQDRGFEFKLPDNIAYKVNESTAVVIPASGGNAE